MRRKLPYLLGLAFLMLGIGMGLAIEGPFRFDYMTTQVKLEHGNIKVGVFLPEFPPERNLLEFEEKVGHVDLISWYTKWDQSMASQKLLLTCQQGRLPMITWESWNRDKTPVPLADIAEGKHDEWVKARFRELASCKGTVLLRFDHEMNTVPGKQYWYPWQGQPTEYVAAWRHLVALGRETAPNIRWVWSPVWVNRQDTYPVDPYWPGAEWVDYVGITVNQYWLPGKTDSEWQSFSALYGAMHEKLASFGKPVVVAEAATGPGPTPQAKAQWIDELFASLPRFPEVVAIVWFDHFGSYEGKTMHWEIETPSEFEAFRKGVESLRR